MITSLIISIVSQRGRLLVANRRIRTRSLTSVSDRASVTLEAEKSRGHVCGGENESERREMQREPRVRALRAVQERVGPVASDGADDVRPSDVRAERAERHERRARHGEPADRAHLIVRPVRQRVRPEYESVRERQRQHCCVLQSIQESDM